MNSKTAPNPPPTASSSSSSSKCPPKQPQKGLFIDDIDDEEFLPKAKFQQKPSVFGSTKPNSNGKKDQQGPGNSDTKRLSPIKSGNGNEVFKKPNVTRKTKTLIPPTFDDIETEIEKDMLSGGQVNALISKVGSHFQTAVKAKKQKYTSLFKIGDTLSETIKASHHEQMEERQVLFDKFKGRLEEITTKLRETVKAQTLIEEKQNKLATSMARANAETKPKLQEVLKQQETWVQKINEDTEKADVRAEETTEQIQETAKSIQILYRKRLSEVHKESSDVFKRFCS